MNQVVAINLMIVLFTGFVVIKNLIKMPKAIRIIVAASIVLMLATLLYMLTYHEQTVFNLLNRFNIDIGVEIK